MSHVSGQIADIAARGWIPRQHHDPEWPIGTKIVGYSTRCMRTDDDEDFPLVHEAEEFKGDDLGMTHWPIVEDARPCAAWNWHWPVIVEGAQAGADKDCEEEKKKRAKKKKEETETKERSKKNRKQKKSPSSGGGGVGQLRPMRAPGQPDTRFQRRSIPNALGPVFPDGWTGTVGGCTEENSQVQSWHPDFLGIVCSNKGDPVFSTPVYETKQGKIGIGAPTHSAWAVVDAGAGACGVAGIVLAHQLGNALSDGRPGQFLMVDYDLCDLGIGSVAGDGPFLTGDKRCQHLHGMTADGLEIRPVHLSTNARYLGPAAAGTGDGPQFFETTQWNPTEEEGAHWRMTHHRWEPELIHGGCTPGFGMWAWQTSFDTYIPDPPPWLDPRVKGRGFIFSPDPRNPNDPFFPLEPAVDMPPPVGLVESPTVGQGGDYWPRYPNFTQCVVLPGFLLRAFGVLDGDRDLTGDNRPTRQEVLDHEAWPILGGIAGAAAQVATDSADGLSQSEHYTDGTATTYPFSQGVMFPHPGGVRPHDVVRGIAQAASAIQFGFLNGIAECAWGATIAREPGRVASGFVSAANTLGDLVFEHVDGDGTKDGPSFGVCADGALLMHDLGTDPPTPAAGKLKFYVKNDQLFYRDDGGTVVGPLGTGGAGLPHLDGNGTTAIFANTTDPTKEVAFNLGNQFTSTLTVLEFPNINTHLQGQDERADINDVNTSTSGLGVAHELRGKGQSGGVVHSLLDLVQTNDLTTVGSPGFGSNVRWWLPNAAGTLVRAAQLHVKHSSVVDQFQISFLFGSTPYLELIDGGVGDEVVRISSQNTGGTELANIATPNTPAAGFGRFYSKTDAPHWLDSSGTETNLLTLSAVPTGTQLPYAGAGAPAGFLLADGASYLTATYPALFAVIGYTYGGAGPNFNVPDARGRTMIGAGTGPGLSARSLGAYGGFEGVTLAAHTHSMQAHTHSIGQLVVTGPNTNHSHVTRVYSVGGGTGVGLVPSAITTNGLTVSNNVPTQLTDVAGDLKTAASNTGGPSVANTGSAGVSPPADSNMTPFCVATWIIKT